MAENVAGSSVSTVSTVQNASSISSGAGNYSSTINIPSDSFKLLVRVSNSSGLSGIEKSGLMRDIAYADRFSMPKFSHVRKEMMNNIASTASFLEHRSAHNAEASANRADRSLEIQRAFTRYNQVLQTAPKVSNVAEVATKQVQQAKSTIERNSIVMTKQSQADVARSVSASTVPQGLKVDVGEVAQAVAKSAPQIQIKTSANSDMVEVSFKQASKSDIPVAELNLPGSNPIPQDDIVVLGSGAESEYEAIPLPGSGDSAEFVQLNLPGSNSGETFVALNLPGSGDSEDFNLESQQQRIARLESLGVLNLDAPEASQVVKSLGRSIESEPELALGSFKQLPLPGSVVQEVAEMVEFDLPQLSVNA